MKASNKITRLIALKIHFVTKIMAKNNVNVHCSCRMPKEYDEFMISCDVCHQWLNTNCVNIKETVFQSNGSATPDNYTSHGSISRC